MLGVEEIAQDGEEPRPDVAALLELLGTGPGPQECLLHEIVCPNAVMRQRQRKGAQFGHNRQKKPAELSIGSHRTSSHLDLKASSAFARAGRTGPRG